MRNILYVILILLSYSVYAQKKQVIYRIGTTLHISDGGSVDFDGTNWVDATGTTR